MANNAKKNFDALFSDMESKYGSKKKETESTPSSTITSTQSNRKDTRQQRFDDIFSSMESQYGSKSIPSTMDVSTISNWYKSANDLYKKGYSYLSQEGWRQADNSIADEIDKHIAQSKDVRKYLYNNRDKLKDYKDIVSGYIQTVRNLEKMRDGIKSTNDSLSKFKSEDEYNAAVEYNFRSSEDNREGRQKRYEDNKANIDNLWDAYENGSTIELWYQDYKERPWEFTEEEAKENLAKYNQYKQYLKQYGSRSGIKAEIDSLEADNRKYERGADNYVSKTVDDYYGLKNNADFAVGSANRDYTNASREELWAYDVSASEGSVALNSGGYFDDDGNIRDSKGNIVQYADAPVVEDKLGLFLSAGEGAVTEALNMLSAGNGNYTNTWANLMQEGDVNGWKHISETELSIYYYLYQNEGQESAYKFLEELTPTLTRRETEATTEWINKQNGWAQFGLNLASIPMNVFGGVASFVDDASNIIQGKDVNPYSRAHSLQNAATDIRSKTATDINDLTGNAALPWVGTTWGDVYQSLMSAGDSLFGASMGGTTYGTLMGMGAASAEMRDLYEKGATMDQIAAGGILAGAAEMIFEKYSIDKLVSISNTKGFKSFLINTLKQGGVEASEELFTEIANTISDAIVMGNQSDWEDVNTFAKSVVNAGIGGFISGLLGGGVSSGADYANYRNQSKEYGQKIIDQGGVDQLQDLAMEMAGAKDGLNAKAIGKLSKKVSSKATATRVGMLADTIADTNAAQSKAEIQKALTEKGLTKNEAKRVAEYLYDATQGKEFTDAQAEEAEKSDIIRQVYAELVGKKDAPVYEREQKLLRATNKKAFDESEEAQKTAQDIAMQMIKKNLGIDDESLDKSTEATFTPKGVYNVSKEGKATDKEGNAISIKGVASIRKGELILETTDGKTINAKDVSFDSDGTALIYEAISNLGDNINAETANKLLAKYDGGDAMVFARGVAQAYTYGFYGIHRSEVTSDKSLSSKLTEAQRNYAYELGKKYRPTKDAADLAKTMETRKPTGEKGVFYRDKDGKLTDIKSYLEQDKRVFNSKQKTTIDLMETMSGAMGMRFFIVESWEENGTRYYLDKNGVKQEGSPNGFYDPKTGDIYIDLFAGTDFKGTMVFTLAHELTHFIRQWSPEHFTKIAKIVFQHGDMKGNIGAMIAEKQALAKANGKPISYDTAMEEVVADSMETILADGKVVEFMADLKKKDLKGWEKVKQWFKDLAQMLKDFINAYSGQQAHTEQGRRVAEFSKELLTQIEQIFAEGAVTGSENRQEAVDGYKAEQEQMSTDTLRGSADGAVVKSETTEALTEELFSWKTETEALPKQVMSLSDGSGKLLDFIEGLRSKEVKGLAGKSTNGYTGRDVRGNAMSISGFTKAEITEVNKFMDTMADFMKEAGVTYKFIGLQDVENAQLHYTYNADGSIKSIVLSAMVKNGDYPVNFDLSSICKKRVAMSKLIDKIARRGSLDNGTVKLTPANIFKINTALKDAGYETACLGCFVESKRYNSLEWAKKFCSKWNAAVKKVNPNATYFGYGDASFTDDSFTLEQAVKIDQAATKYITATKTERLQNALAKYKAKEEAGLPLVESFSKAARERLVKSDTISDELKDKYLNCDPTTLNIADVEFLLENGILPGAALSNKQAVTEMVKSGEAYQHLLRPSDLLTDRGISKLEALPNFHGVLYGHYGSGTPKLMQSYTPYNSEIALLSAKKGDQTLAEYLYTIAGVRMQSFSDFQIQNIYDYLQMVGDLAARKVPAHAYTKEISFAKLLGMTGIKVNLSVMFDIDPMVDKAHAGLTKLNKLVHRGEYARVVLEDEQGKWVYNIGDYQTQKLFAEAFPDEAKRFLQSIGFGDAVKLQSSTGYSSNCGIIGVGYSDLGIFAMLDDNRIRYIIPYHASSLPAEIKLATHIDHGTDYTPYQNNMKIKEIVDRNGNKVNWSIKEAYKRLKSGQAVIDELNEKIRTDGWVVSTSKAQTGHGTYGLYENLMETNDPRQTAGNFIDWCIGNGTLPLFYQFASHENYYKLIYDYNVYDCVTEEYAPQQAVTNTYPTMVDGQVQPGTVTDGGFDAEYFKGTIDKQMAFMNEYSRSLDEDLDALAENVEGGNYSLNSKVKFADRNPMLTEADLDEYMRTGQTMHTRNKKQRLLEAGKSPILTTSADVKVFMGDVIKGKAGGEVRAFGKVGNRLAMAIMDIRESLDLTGNYLELNADDLRESYKRHSTPKEAGDVPLSEADFESIPEYLDEFDGVLSVNEHNGKVDVHIYKQVSEDYVRILAVSSKERRSLQVTKLIGVSREKFETKYAKKIERTTGSLRSESENSEGSNPSTKAQLTAGGLSGAIIAHFDEDVKMSDRDSVGNLLSEAQQEFFKDSVVRDANGNLLVMYHGTSYGGHTVFDSWGKGKYGLFGIGTYFTESRGIAETYTKKGRGNNPQVYECYLNIKKPMDMDAQADPAEWQNAFPDADFPKAGTNEEFYRAAELYLEDEMIPRWEGAERMLDAIGYVMGYDGITHIGGGRVNADGERHRVYIAFEPEQIKNTDNTNPTDDPDIRYSDRILMGSLFSGGGTLEAGLAYQMLDKEFGVEYDGKIASVYAANHGDHIQVGKVEDFDISKYDDIFYLHASPVCHNFSKAKHGAKELKMDIDSAKATAKHLETAMPQVFTVENAPGYRNSESLKIITDKLTELGYKWDVDVYNSADYGSATSRNRVILRAVKDGELPAKPTKQARTNSWDKVTRDLWDTLPKSYLRPSFISAIENTRNLPILDANGKVNVNKPLLILTTTSGHTVTYCWEGDICPTLTTKCGEAKLVMPDGNIYAVSPEFMGRIQGLPNDYKYPKAKTRAFTIIGNGIPTHLTKAVVGGVLDSAYEQTHDGQTLYSDRDYVAYDSTAILKEETVGRWLREYATKSQPKYAHAYITYIRPDRFLDLTTSVGGRAYIESESRDLDEADFADYTKDNPILLEIDHETGNVTGHEGRHRCVALQRAGITYVPVLLLDYSNKYDKQAMDSLKLTGQVFANSRSYDQVYVYDILPLNYENREEVIKRFATQSSMQRVGERLGMRQTLRFQDRTEDTSSNRAILANAFEGVAQTPDEKQMVAQYKANVGKANDAQQRLNAINQKIKELSFGKGARDAKKIAELRGKAKELSKLIDSYDKQLLKLEATEPLQNILKREKEAVRRRERARAGKSVREATSKARETRDKRDAREKLNKLVVSTIKWISYPAKTDVKCPDILKKPYYDFLQGIDMSSKRLAEGGDPTKVDLRLASAMDSLATALERITDSQDPSKSTNDADDVLSVGYLDLPVDFVKKLRDMTEKVKSMMVDGDFVVNNMTSAEVRKLSQMIRTLNKSIKEVSKLYANYRFANVEELGADTMSFVDALGEAEKTGGVGDFVTWDNALPYYAFKRFGTGGESIFEGLMDAQDKLAFLAKDIFAFQEATWTGKEAKAWGEDTHTISLPSGGTLTLTTADAMSIYCLSRRAHAVPHLLGGGVRVMGLKKGSKKAMDSRSTLTIEDINAITDSLSDRQKSVAESIQAFMSTVCSDWGNEISMKRFLTKEFNEKFYFPIESNDENLPTKDPAAQQSDLFRLLNISATKPLTEGANNEVIIRNIFDVFTGHAADMARLNAYGMALLDYMKWLNYREKTANEEGQIDVRGVRKSMNTAYGDAAYSYVLNLIKDVNGRASDGGEPTILMKWMRAGKTASVGNSLRVATLQVTAYPRAALVLSPKSLALGLAKKPNIEKAKKYCGIALWKSFGFYDANISRSIEDQMKGVTDFKQKLIELSLKGAEIGDALTWGALWNACEYEVAATKEFKVGSEEFNQAVGKKLREVVYRTQVVDSMLTRSQIMRSKRGFAQEASAFMSEPTVSANILMDAGFQFNAEKRRTGSAKVAWKNTAGYIGKALAVYSVGQLAAALLEGLWDAWRDDEDEEFGEKYLDAFLENLALDLVPFNKIPIISDLFEAVSAMFGVGFYSSDKMSTTWITQAVSAVDAWKDVLSGSSSTTIYNALYKTTRSVSSIYGFSLSGLMREGVALWNNTAGAYDSTLKIRQYELPNEKLGVQLYEAIISGNTRQAKSLMAEFEDESAMGSALRKALRENDPRIKEAAQAQIDGDPSRRVEIAEDIIADGFSQEDVRKAINSEISEMNPGETSSSDKEYGFYDATDFALEIANGDKASASAAKADYIDTAKKNGKTQEEAEKSFKSSAKTAMKKLYLSGDLSESKAINALEAYCGMDDDDIHWTLKEWRYEQSTGTSDGYSKYNDFHTAVQTGKSLKAVIKEYTDNGVEPKTLASQITEYFKPLYKNMSNNERASIKGYLLNAYELLGYDRSKKSKDIDKWLED